MTAAKTDAEPKFVLTLDRVLDAPVANVWRCWSEPKLFEQWFCPKPWYVTDAVLDLRVGGEFSSVMHGPDGETFPQAGVFLEVVPMKKLMSTDAFRPGWAPADQAFMVAETTMSDAGGGKTKYVSRAMHWSEDALKQHEAMGFHDGWGAAATQLEALAKSL